ncbi:MAG: hypothetical protein FOGNACKC_01404 [Anaerolineae bacterium]|nr:hypothetical protein [Anaerolineae bacterium]
MERWEIPSDWTEEDGYTTVLFCIPNSRAWRGLIVGMVESLAFGWSWDEQTGVVKDVQAIGREIFESMSMCKLDEVLGGLRLDLQATNSQLAGINAALAQLSNLDSLPTVAANTGHLSELPGAVTQLTDLAADTNALSNLAQLANITTNLGSLAELVNLVNALGPLTDLASLVQLAANSDALQQLGGLAWLQNINAGMDALHGDAAAANATAATVAAELGDINTDLDALVGVPDIVSHLALLQQRFITNNTLYPDYNVADTLLSGLIGRQIDLPIPWAGAGLADILDQQGTAANANLTSLDGRFRQADNIIGEKNITETLETLLRKTALLDPEAYPNVADIMDNVFRLGGDESWLKMLQRNLQSVLVKLGIIDPPTNDPDKTTITQAILMLVTALASDDAALRSIAAAIKDNPVKINLNNLNNCNGKALNGNGKGESIVTTITDEGVKVEQIEAPSNPLLGRGN